MGEIEDIIAVAERREARLVKENARLRRELAEARKVIQEAASRARKRVCRTCSLPSDACNVHGEPTRHATCERWAKEARRLERELDAAMAEGGEGEEDD